jgi:hypothetical protein
MSGMTLKTERIAFSAKPVPDPNGVARKQPVCAGRHTEMKAGRTKRGCIARVEGRFFEQDTAPDMIF